MQVFMPSADLQLSVTCLDPKRLGNQIYREALTLARGKWPNHPAAKLWANHKRALAAYCLYGLAELEARGRSYPHWVQFFRELHDTSPDTGLPSIVGYAPFHAGHRAALLAKDPEWYGQLGWTETPEPDTRKAYVWERQP